MNEIPNCIGTVILKFVSVPIPEMTFDLDFTLRSGGKLRCLKIELITIQTDHMI